MQDFIIERRYSGLSREQLAKHITFCARALAADRSADVVMPEPDKPEPKIHRSLSCPRGTPENHQRTVAPPSTAALGGHRTFRSRDAENTARRNLAKK
jgi:hypothetical protein